MATAIRAGGAQGTASPASVTLGGTPASGNVLVAHVIVLGTSTVLSANTGWTKLTDAVPAAGDDSALFRKTAGAGESTTQSPATISGTITEWACCMAEYAFTGSSPTPTENATTGSSTISTTPTVTPPSGVEGAIVCGAGALAKRTYSLWQVNASATGVNNRASTTATQPTNTLWDALPASTSGSYVGAATSGSPGSSFGASIAVFTVAAAQDTPELYGRPFGLHGQAQMHQLLAQ